MKMSKEDREAWDKYAAAAMGSLISQKPPVALGIPKYVEEVVVAAGNWADAMFEQRKKRIH